MREAVAKAIYHGVITDSRRRFRSIPHWEATSDAIREEYRRLADFAITEIDLLKYSPKNLRVDPDADQR